jgi:hypothetical protein
VQGEEERRRGGVQMYLRVPVRTAAAAYTLAVLSVLSSFSIIVARFWALFFHHLV